METRVREHKINYDKTHLVNYVLVASETGAYGGPFDTSVSQVQLFTDSNVSLLAGFFVGDRPLLTGLQSDLHPVRHLLNGNSFLDVGSFSQIKSFWRAASSGQAHISFARGFGPMLFVLFCRIRGCALVLQPHGMLTARSSTAHRVLDFLITKPLIPKNARIIALTKQEEKDLLIWLPRLAGKVFPIPNPPLVARVEQIETTFVNSAIFVGRLHPRKRVLDFGLAALLAGEKGWSEKYVVLGPDEGELEPLLRLTRASGNFEYLGSTNKDGVLARVKGAGVLVLNSEKEPFGNVLVAALCLGKPVVVTKSSALAPLIKFHKAGIVVDDHSPNGIAEAVHEILDGGRYAFFANNALRVAKIQFDSNKVRKDLVRAYNRKGFSES